MRFLSLITKLESQIDQLQIDSFAILPQEWSKIAGPKNVDLSSLIYKVNIDFIDVKSPLFKVQSGFFPGMEHFLKLESCLCPSFFMLFPVCTQAGCKISNFAICFMQPNAPAAHCIPRFPPSQLGR